MMPFLQFTMALLVERDHLLKRFSICHHDYSLTLLAMEGTLYAPTHTAFRLGWPIPVGPAPPVSGRGTDQLPQAEGRCPAVCFSPSMETDASTCRHA